MALRTSQCVWVISTLLILFSFAATGLVALLSAFCVPALISIVRAACFLHSSSDEIHLLSSEDTPSEPKPGIQRSEEEAVPLASEDENAG